MGCMVNRKSHHVVDRAANSNLNFYDNQMVDFDSHYSVRSVGHTHHLFANPAVNFSVDRADHLDTAILRTARNLVGDGIANRINDRTSNLAKD